MKDRIPANPGRVKITPENGGPSYYVTMERADNPVQEGTPLNKETFLKDETAALYGLDENAVPDDVFNVMPKPQTITRTEVITESGNWEAPNLVGPVHVRLFGGGGGGGGAAENINTAEGTGGGGGGYMETATIDLEPGAFVYITIGAGGDVGKSGGISSFGSYLSASGGGAGDRNGGSGGTGGGGVYGAGGNGSYGGGGGCGYAVGGSSKGGTYGGGGGYTNSSTPNNGGTYGGAGGNINTYAKDGTNTVGMGLEFEGTGAAGSNYCGGGGGYGGKGGKGGSGNGPGGGGGGGYGANGGNGRAAYISSNTISAYSAGGGGGGYGGSGGNAKSTTENESYSDYGTRYGGGGGGYGYGGKGGDGLGGNGGLAAGGGGGGGLGGSGVCILTYTCKVMM